ncbi:MAG: hypothetical protein JWQ75_2017 [Pseudarthrobacter sp.]|nr:hypothetical protein [Pseudarthrobacter sp.]
MDRTSSPGSAPTSSWAKFLEYETSRRTTVLMGLAAVGAVALVPWTKADAAEPTVLRINAGGPAVTTGGVSWAADQYFTGGKSFSIAATAAIAGTIDDVLYRTERSATTNLGSFSYAIPVAGAGDYTVTLHFAEIWFGATGGGTGGAGKRVFSANFEGGATELVNFDIFATAGTMTATTKTFTVPVSDGTLNVQFTATVDQPKISAIEVVFPTATTPPPPPPATGEVLRINAGGPSVTAGGVLWGADQYFTGGKAFENTSVGDIAGTTADVLYTSERSASTDLGSFAYAIPVPVAGSYTVKLHFAEIWFGAPGGDSGGAGKRKFSVNIQGGNVEMPSYDIYSEVGAASAAVKVFTVNVTGTVLNIVFTATVDQPKVSAIEVEFPAGATVPPPSAVSWPSTWSAAASAPAPIFEAAGVALGGLVYRFGGFNATWQVLRSYHSYNPATNSWKSLGTLPTGMAESHLGITQDGRYIYLAGGFAGKVDDTKNPTQTISNRVYRYDPASNVFQQITTLPQARGGGAFAALNGKLHYITGNSADRVTNVSSHYVYDLALGTWGTAAAFPNPKDHVSYVVAGGKIYVMGGEHGHSEQHEQQSDFHSFDPAANAWTRLPDMPMAKSHIEGGTFVSGGHIIMAGGQTHDFQPTAQVAAFDLAKNTWSTLASLPVPRQGAIVQRVDNRIVFALGALETHEPQSGVWIGQLP